MKTNNYFVLFSLIIFSACNSTTEKSTQTINTQKKQSIDEAFTAVHNAPTTGILEKLDNKIKTVKDGDSRKAIIALMKNAGNGKNLSSLSSNNEVEIEKDGKNTRVTLVTKSSLSNSETRITLYYTSNGKETGTFDLGLNTFYLSSKEKDGSKQEIKSISTIKGTLTLIENDDHKLKGTAAFTVPKFQLYENGKEVKTMDNIEMEVAFFNANL